MELEPFDAVHPLLFLDGVELPKWVKKADSTKQKAIKNAEKLRKNQPKEEPAEEAAEAETEE